MADRSQVKRVPVNIVLLSAAMFAVMVVIQPGRLTTLIANLVPGVYESVPCSSLRAAEDRAFHQSLIGRGAPNPLALEVRASPIPASADGFLNIQIIVINTSLGTVPIVYDPNQVVIGDNGSSGLGLLFSPANSLSFNNRVDPAVFADSQLRLLQPRQRCVHTVSIPAGNVLVDPALTSGQAQVQAFYRNASRGSTITAPGVLSTPIFRDQGLWIGAIQSAPGQIALSPPPAAAQ